MSGRLSRRQRCARPPLAAENDLTVAGTQVRIDAVELERHLLAVHFGADLVGVEVGPTRDLELDPDIADRAAVEVLLADQHSGHAVDRELTRRERTGLGARDLALAVRMLSVPRQGGADHVADLVVEAAQERTVRFRRRRHSVDRGPLGTRRDGEAELASHVPEAALDLAVRPYSELVAVAVLHEPAVLTRDQRVAWNAQHPDDPILLRLGCR